MQNSWIVGIPIWIFAVPAGLAAVWFYIRSRRPLPGHCRCGYDLAGIANGAPCPECGRAAVTTGKPAGTPKASS